MYTRSMETIYLFLRAQIVLGTFFMKFPVCKHGFPALYYCFDCLAVLACFLPLRKNLFSRVSEAHNASPSSVRGVLGVTFGGEALREARPCLTPLTCWGAGFTWENKYFTCPSSIIVMVPFTTLVRLESALT